MERIIGEIYGGTPNAAGSSMYPSIRAITISFAIGHLRVSVFTADVEMFFVQGY
jgi:hypothetical protein